MDTFLGKIGQVLTSAIGWAGSVASAITSDSTGAIIVPFVLAFTLFGIHMFKSLSGR